MLNLTYEYKLIPIDAQRETFDHWLEICRKVYNFALRERKDWVNSRKCNINSCSIKQEYIIPADAAHTGKKELSERVHKCSECGYETLSRCCSGSSGVAALGHIAVNFGEGKLHE